MQERDATRAEVRVAIRRVLPEECGALGALTVAAYRDLYHGQPLGPYEEELLDVDRRRLDSEVYVALEETGTLMGGVTFVPGPQHAMAEFNDPDGSGIRMLAVDPAFQGRGAGRALVATCVARAKEVGRERIVLHSTPAMTRAHAMYAALGFVRAPELDEFIRANDDGDDDENGAGDDDGDVLHLLAFVLELRVGERAARD